LRTSNSTTLGRGSDSKHVAAPLASARKCHASRMAIVTKLLKSVLMHVTYALLCVVTPLVCSRVWEKWPTMMTSILMHARLPTLWPPPPAATRRQTRHGTTPMRQSPPWPRGQPRCASAQQVRCLPRAVAAVARVHGQRSLLALLKLAPPAELAKDSMLAISWACFPALRALACDNTVDVNISEMKGTRFK
jgi:hypothetical protein